MLRFCPFVGLEPVFFRRVWTEFCCCNHIELPHGLIWRRGTGPHFNSVVGEFVEEYLWRDRIYNRYTATTLQRGVVYQEPVPATSYPRASSLID